MKSVFTIIAAGLLACSFATSAGAAPRQKTRGWPSVRLSARRRPTRNTRPFTFLSGPRS